MSVSLEHNTASLDFVHLFIVWSTNCTVWLASHLLAIFYIRAINLIDMITMMIDVLALSHLEETLLRPLAITMDIIEAMDAASRR